jgi:hypothetical protein
MHWSLLLSDSAKRMLDEFSKIPMESLFAPEAAAPERVKSAKNG